MADNISELDLLSNDLPDRYAFHLKSHDLIYASTDLTPRMMDILALMLTAMRPEHWFDEQDKEIVPDYTFNSDQLSEFFEVPKKQLYSILKKPAAELASKRIGFENGKEFEYYPILSQIIYKNSKLTITPNGKLRNQFITNSANNGWAKIDNKIFKALRNANSKKVFEFLSRYRFKSEMYFIRLSKLKHIFGVYDENNRLKKKSYESSSQFIHKVIIPSMKEINELLIAKTSLNLLEKDGNLGFEMTNEADPQIKFNVHWINAVSPEEKVKASQEILACLTKLQQYKVNGKRPSIEELKALKQNLRLIGQTERADQVENRIQDEIRLLAIKKNEKPNKELEESQTKIDELFKLNLI